MKQIILSLLASMIGIASIEHIKLQAYRIAIAAMYGFFALLCGVVLFICLVAALWIYLVRWVGPVGAPLVVGTIFLIVAVGLLFAARRAFHRGHPPRPTVPATTSSMPMLTGRNLPASGIRELGNVAISGFLVGMLRKR